MIRFDLDSQLKSIVDSVKHGTAMEKQASDASTTLSNMRSTLYHPKSEASMSLLKLAEQAWDDNFTYQDIHDALHEPTLPLDKQATEDTEIKTNNNIANALLKIASTVETDTKLSPKKLEKVAKFMDILGGLELLKRKIA